MFKKTIQRWSQALREALTCIALGLRDVRHGGLWWRSALCSVAVVTLWFWLYRQYPEFFLQLSRDMALLGVFGLFGIGVLDLGPGIHAGAPTLSNMGSLQGLGGLLMTILSIAQILLAFLALVAFVYVLIFVTGVLGTVSLPSRWVCLPRARSTAAGRYPDWQVPAIPAPAAGFSVRRILAWLALLIPVWTAVVMVRMLLTSGILWVYGPASAGLLTAGQRRALWAAQRPAIVMLGMLLGVMTIVPILNLLVPALVCTSVCHLQRRGWTVPPRD